MSRDLKESHASCRLQFSYFNAEFLAAMHCGSDPTFDERSSKMFQKAIGIMHQLYASLESHRQAAYSRIRKGVNAVDRLLYSFDDSGFRDEKIDVSVLIERLMQTSSLRPKFKFDDIVAMCLSTNAQKDLLSCNSLLPPKLCARLIEGTAAVMMHAVRLGQIIKCLSSTVRLIDDLVLFAAGRICARFRKEKLVIVKDMLILNAFSPFLVQLQLQSNSSFADLLRSPEIGSPFSNSSPVYDDCLSSNQHSGGYDDQQASDRRPLVRSSANALARRQSLRSILKRQTSVDSPKGKQFNHVEIQLKNLENAAVGLASLLMEGRDYSVASLSRIQSQVSGQAHDEDCSSVDIFDPRYLVLE